MRRERLALCCAVLLALSGCDGPTVDVDPNGVVPDSPAPPVCLWNHAYTENYDHDSIDAILAGARGCYVLIDPYEEAAAQEAIPAIRAAGNTLGCYISVGTCEDWRDDYEAIREFCTTQEWEEWEGEFYVSDVNGITPAMEARIDQLALWGCDMVEFDNMDWASDEDQNAQFGLEVTPAEAIAYYQGLCDYVHAAGMGCMAKSTREGAEDFDGGTFESYPYEVDWWEHEHLQSFIDEGRLGVIFHYDEPDCDDVALWYRQRYGRGLSFLCEDPSVNGYRH